MKLARVALALAVIGGAAAGCGGSGGQGSLIHDVKFDVGGRVLYAPHPDRPLSGVTVTLTDEDGDTKTATTASNGLWTANNLHPGTWTVRYEAPGYEPVVTVLSLEVEGENDIENAFIGLADEFLVERLLGATVTPFGVLVRNDETHRDGFEGVVLEYSVSADGDVVVTFDRSVIDADGNLEDTETGQDVGGSFDPVANTLTFDAADIDTMNAGATPLTTDSDPWTWHRIDIDALAITPINSDFEFFNATLHFNAVP